MAHKRIKAPPDGKTFSPWAQRIGLSARCLDPAFQKGPLFHSGYAPEHPLFYADRPDTSNTGNFQDLNDIDKLFVAEHQETTMLEGIRLWQIGPVCQTLKFSDRVGLIPGGNQRQWPDQNPERIAQLVSEMEMIKPNEQSWFSFFKRDRWFNGPSNVSLLGDQPWSIDHPQVGFYMSIILELANRMLNALINDRNWLWVGQKRALNETVLTRFFSLNAMLFGYIGHWEKVGRLLQPNLPADAEFFNERVLLSWPRFAHDGDTSDPELQAYMEQAANRSADEYKTTLERLLSRLQWAFQEGSDQYSFAVTHLEIDVITVNVLPFMTLLGNDATLAERCVRLFHSATVILHEICHAIMKHRMDEVFGENVHLKEPVGSSMQFLDFNGATEMGLDFEQAVFGAVLHVYNVDDVDRPPIMIHTRNWPYAWIDKERNRGVYEWIPGHADFADGKLVEISIIPAEYASKLLSEAFWKDETIPKKSENFFHRNPLFVCRAENDNSLSLSAIVYSLEIDPNLDVTKLDRSEINMIQEWQENERLWNTSRDSWFRSLKGIWRLTAWSRAIARNRISAFNYAYPEKDLLTCSKSASEMVRRYIKWDEDVSGEEYGAELQKQSSWVFHAIALLMYAALPILDEEIIEDKGYIRHDHVTEFPPSLMAAGKPNIKLWGETYKSGGGFAEANEFFDPFTAPNTAATDFTQMDYLDLVLQIIQHLALNGIQVSTPWLNEIMRVEKSIRAARETIKATAVAGFDPKQAWAGVWDFQIPTYDPDDMSHWPGPPNLEWQRVPH
ncbi:hypothetical protein F5Y12DRAFT_709410 [Xylaria sp. FL1777]|nr:hypothetical protein F5Y12DRAFT_709410 [Xylaria sp. FL1777]